MSGTAFYGSTKQLGCVVADLDQNGLPDIYVANDGVPNFCFMQGGDQEFVNEAYARGVAVDAHGRSQGSMGIAIGDADRNGWLDLFLTHFYSETKTFYQATSQGNYRDATRSANLATDSQLLLGFGTAFIDPDNNGWLDLFVSNGHIDDMRWRLDTLPYRMPPLMFQNTQDGRFENISSACGDYFQQEWLGRGVATVDIDCDGRVDLAISQQLDRSSVLLNETPLAGNFLTVQCIGVQSNRSAISTKLWLRKENDTFYQEIVGGGSYNSASDLCAHFGLGDALPKSLKVQWLDGQVETFDDLTVGRFTVIQGRGMYVAP